MSTSPNANQRGFSLLEMISVVVIIGVIAALTIPAFVGVNKSQAISNAGSALLDQLAAARQAAVARNRVVEVRLYKRRDPDAGNNTASFRSFRTMIYDESVLRAGALSTMQKFPVGVILYEDKFPAADASATPYFSTLLCPFTSSVPQRTYLKEDLSPQETDVPYQVIRFKPTGGTDLGVSGTPDKDKWCLTIKSENDPGTASKPANNYFTIMLDPVSGRVRTYRP